MINYLNPQCRPSTLDSYANVQLLLGALQRELGKIKGEVLDIGCGRMPYKPLILSEQSRATRYIGLDIPNGHYGAPDLVWDGTSIPLPDCSVDTAILTEVLEHCPDGAAVLREAYRVLRPSGSLFLTVPFVWPIHCVPYDEFRYTPFSLQRILEDVGFSSPSIEATGGRHAVLAVILGLWVRRRPLTSRVHVVTKAVLSFLLWPLIWSLVEIDKRPDNLGESTLFVGLSVSVRKPA